MRALEADLGVAGDELDLLIRRQSAGAGVPVSWKMHGHDRPAELAERLRAAGFEPEATSTVMIGHAREQAARPELPDGVRVRRVDGMDDLRALADLQSRVWDMDASFLVDHLASRIASTPDGIEILAVESGDELVSSAWLMPQPGTEFAILLGGATEPAWQGRGIYRALIAARARSAVARGITYLQVDASERSRPILRRRGFQAVTTSTPYTWRVPAPPTTVQG